MAKVTMNDMVFEGTPEEIAAVFAEMEKRQAKAESEVGPVFIEEPKEEPLKHGDYAKVIGIEATESHRGRHGFEIGEIVKIELINDVNQAATCAKLNGNYAPRKYVSLEDIVKATEEEVTAAKAEIEAKKVEAKWTEIGRKPNELKTGDIVRVIDSPCAHPEGSLVEVQTVYTDASLSAKGYDEGYGRIVMYGYALDDVELITPVEARFDR